MESERRTTSTSSDRKPKFSIYQNNTFSAALTAKSLRPSTYALLLLFSISCVSTFALVAITSRKDKIVALLVKTKVSYTAANWVLRSLEVLVGLIFVATLTALLRAFSLRNMRNVFDGIIVSSSNKRQEKLASLTSGQLGLLGLKAKEELADNVKLAKNSLKLKPIPFMSDPLVPIRKPMRGYSPSRVSGFGSDQKSTSGGQKTGMSTVYASAYTVSPSTPWSKSASSGKGILTEEMLEQFLADVDEKIMESATRTATPPATIRGFGMSSPSSVTNSATNSGATRTTPLRPVRMSPGSHKKYGTPPKKGDGEVPTPMTMEKMIEAYNNLGIYPQIEKWRDRLRQWLSTMLLNPLVEKIETSHIQVMQAAAALGVSINVSQVGTDSPTSPATVNVSPIDGCKEWQPTFTLDEDGCLHQLRATLQQARDGSVIPVPLSSGQPQQQNPFVPVIHACIDAITEHQRLNSLMKGELVKGLLPQSTVRADYTVKRIQELAEGTCIKNYEYVSEASKNWPVDLPSDSHLLSYLFCAFLDHPKWMLHVDPTSYTNIQSSKNPLFLGFLPPKNKFPEKYVAIISNDPTVVHPGACILVIGKQTPPAFTLYWDKKPQFSLQGRTALWDAILLLCYRIKLKFGGVVRGVHLGSSAFNILAVLETENNC